jgi:hypothetical protein
MSRHITVTLDIDGEGSYRQLAVIPFVETTPGRHLVFGIGPAEIRVSPNAVVTLTAQWCAGNNMTSIVVHRDGKIVGHAGMSWERGDPYLGLRLEGDRFLHFNCGRPDE